MYVLGFPAVKSVNAHSFQKIGPQKSCGQFGEWDPATYSAEDSLFGTIEFHNGGILWLELSGDCWADTGWDEIGHSTSANSRL